jgi:hypothetical protein
MYVEREDKRLSSNALDLGHANLSGIKSEETEGTDSAYAESKLVQFPLSQYPASLTAWLRKHLAAQVL